MELLNKAKVAEILGISVKTVDKLCREGALNCFQVTKRIRMFTTEHVEEYLKAHPNRAFVQARFESSPDHEGSSQIQIEPDEPNINYTEADLASLRKEMKGW